MVRHVFHIYHDAFVGYLSIISDHLFSASAEQLSRHFLVAVLGMDLASSPLLAGGHLKLAELVRIDRVLVAHIDPIQHVLASRIFLREIRSLQ